MREKLGLLSFGWASPALGLRFRFLCSPLTTYQPPIPLNTNSSPRYFLFARNVRLPNPVIHWNTTLTRRILLSDNLKDNTPQENKVWDSRGIYLHARQSHHHHHLHHHRRQPTTLSPHPYYSLRQHRLSHPHSRTTSQHSTPDCVNCVSAATEPSPTEANFDVRALSTAPSCRLDWGGRLESWVCVGRTDWDCCRRRVLMG